MLGVRIQETTSDKLYVFYRKCQFPCLFEHNSDTVCCIIVYTRSQDSVEKNVKKDTRRDANLHRERRKSIDQF